MKPKETEVFHQQVAEKLLGFPTLNILCSLAETGLHEQLGNGGIVVNDTVSKRAFGPEKVMAGNLGFLYATNQLDKNETGRYVLPEKTIINDRHILTALQLREELRRLSEDWRLVAEIDLKAFLPELRTALAVPLIGIIEENEQRYRSLEKPLTSLGLADEDGLNAIGARLLGHRVIGSYRNLSYSYEEAINHLTEVIENPQTMQFGGSLARNEKRNALSSNELIANVVPRLATYLQRAARTRLVDFGSGGGHFAAGIGMETILFDRSAIANQEALQTFAVRPELIKGMVTGSILDLEKMKEAKQAKPDVATINYILHDILGQPESFAEGVSLVKEFLLNYREVFGQMPLLITESWDVSWDHLREANKPYITLFQWLHEISPQRLMDGGTLADILIECEFMIREVIDHGFLPINGEQVPVNQTLVAVAQ